MAPFLFAVLARFFLFPIQTLDIQLQVFKSISLDDIVRKTRILQDLLLLLTINMLSKVPLLGLIALPAVLSFPWMGSILNSDGSLPNAEDELEKRQGTTMAGCPYNPNHVPAAPITSKFPYLGAANGLPATHPVGNIEVPADDDTAHQYVAPGKNDIRGPCPGLNAAANHNVIYTE